MSADELTIALERLTRFKHPSMRKPRVYKEILSKFTIEPKITTKNTSQFPIKDLDKLVSIIWNESVKSLDKDTGLNPLINEYLALEDLALYSPKELLASSIDARADIEENELITFCRSLGYKTNKVVSDCYLEYSKHNLLNISGLLSFIKTVKTSSLHIKRLIKLNEIINTKSSLIFQESIKLREDNLFGFPISGVVIAEGITEEKLLPLFAKIQGFDFQKVGVKLLSAGGKNQVARMYNELKDILNVPIFVLLDEDAKSIFDVIDKILKPKDGMFLIPEGEFEDILPKTLVFKALNKHFKLSNTVSLEEITSNNSMCSLLNDLWKEKGFGSFNKSLFAEIIAENIEAKEDLSPTLVEIIEKIKVLIN